MEHNRPLQGIPDDELLHRLAQLVRDSRCVDSDLVAHIAEVDERRLYIREAVPSMFSYCTEVLHLSEAEAYLRIAAARASREHPVLLAMLGDGRLHLTAIAKLAPHLTPENRDVLLARATHRSKREVEELVAELSPRPDVFSAIRKLPEPGERAQPMAAPSSADAPAASSLFAPSGAPQERELRPDGVRHAGATRAVAPPLVEPLAPARYKVQFTASAELRDKLERLRALMRSKIPDGDLAAIIEEAVTEKLERLEARRFGATKKPRKRLAETNTSASSRHIPAAVRRVVHGRDGERCSFVDAQGRRCTARAWLEYHHRRPFGYGGDHRPELVALMCKSHNSHLAEHDYGVEKMAEHRRSARRAMEMSSP
jgi:hypothetical protein